MVIEEVKLALKQIEHSSSDVEKDVFIYLKGSAIEGGGRKGGSER